MPRFFFIFPLFMQNQSPQRTAGSLLCLLSVISSPAAAEFCVGWWRRYQEFFYLVH
jgi:hypothetical protein